MDKDVDEKKLKKQKLKAIIFFIWFILSISAANFFNDVSEFLLFIVIGQYFLVFGLIILFSKNDDSFRFNSIPILILGLGFIGISYLIKHPELFNFNIVWESVILLIIVSLFFIIGIIMIILYIMNKKELQKQYNIKVLATITEHINITSDDGIELYCPVYSYEYSNEKYEVATDNYSTKVKPIGTVEKIRINSKKPNELIKYNYNNYKSLIGVAIIDFIITIPILIYILENFKFIK